MGRRPWGVLGCVMAACCPRVWGGSRLRPGCSPRRRPGVPTLCLVSANSGEAALGLLSCCCRPRCSAYQAAATLSSAPGVEGSPGL